MKSRRATFLSFVVASLATAGAPAWAQGPAGDALDRRVEAFLDKMQHRWRDMNVPEQDGRLLHKTILDRGYKRALEVGTSTGLSGIWMAWALSKTGGRLTTVEIDEGRYREALANFKEAGLSDLIDARLADAHELAKQLPGPFDFVFIDADKDWYVNYAKDLIPKIEPGGCLSAHNVREPRSGYGRGRGYGMGGDYYEFMRGQPGFSTSVHPESVGGLAFSFREPKR
jgi:predicted O-methyltransferase YrrM